LISQPLEVVVYFLEFWKTKIFGLGLA